MRNVSAGAIRVGKKGRKANRRGPISISENDYLLTILDPPSYPGVKIPDLVSLPSATFQTENYGIITTNAAGDQAMCFIPRIASQTALQTSATTTWTWAPGSYANNPQSTAIVGVFEQIRPVSMKVRVDFIGSTSADQGSVGMALQARPGSSMTSNEYDSFPTSFSALLTAENSYVGAVRNGLEMIWLPQDNLDLDYFNPSAGIGTSTQYSNRFNSVTLPYIIVGVTGAAASTATFRYTVTVNWEGLANNSTLAFVHTAQSPVNLGKLEQAWNAFGWVRQNLASIVSKSAPYLQTALNGLMAARRMGPALAAGAAAVAPLAAKAAPLLLTM